MTRNTHPDAHPDDPHYITRSNWLRAAVLGANGAKLPLLGKLDIGPTAEGFVILVQEALGPERRHEAIHVKMQLAPGHEVNIFDTARDYIENVLTGKPEEALTMPAAGEQARDDDGPALDPGVI